MRVGYFPRYIYNEILIVPISYPNNHLHITITAQSKLHPCLLRNDNRQHGKSTIMYCNAFVYPQQILYNSPGLGRSILDDMHTAYAALL